MKIVNQKIKLMKRNRVRCDICKTDIHRGSYSRHLKVRSI